MTYSLRWIVDEGPFLADAMVSVVMVEGLHRVWRYLQRLSARVEAAA
jgi:hypothetical protein